MPNNITKFFLLFLIIQCFSCQKNKNYNKNKNKKKIQRPKTTFNSSTKYASSLKLHSHLLQTVYSDSFSKNYYYTTLYVGDKRVKQKYLLDTGNAIMSSPCSPCDECGQHKNNYFYDFNRYHKPLKCNTKLCNLLPANDCQFKKLHKNICSFNSLNNNKNGKNIINTSSDGLKGYYLRDIVYFETCQNKKKLYTNNNYSPDEKTIFRSYAIPIGCTDGEFGEYRNLKTDGIMGLNNSPKSFISVLYNLKIIPENKFSLCFGLYGGYMSLGEIETTYHKKNYIDYVPLLESQNYDYLININGLALSNEKKFISGNHIACIESAKTKTYFPQYMYKSIIKEFDDYCSKSNGACGKFDYYDEGYCSKYPNRSSLFRSVYRRWPNITLYLDDEEYFWTPLHYYYYSFNNLEYKACLGFDGHKSEGIILGANFFHGHDIIFDRKNKRLGFVPSDCSRKFRIWQRGFGNQSIEFLSDPSLVDLEFHKNNEFKLGDNTDKDLINFVEGHNTELENIEEFKTINFVIFLSSMIIVGIIVSIILFILFFNKKGNLKYEPREEVEYQVEQQNDSNNTDENNENNENENNGENQNQEGDNKISFEDTTNENKKEEEEVEEVEEVNNKENEKNENEQ